MIHNLAAQQLASGAWGIPGIMRPPTSDSVFTIAAFAIRVLQQYAPPARRREFDERIERAARLLASSEPATTEDSVTRLLGLRWAGADAAKLQQSGKSLLRLQRTDGGWGQTPYLSSDAYATGTALYALHEAGVPASLRSIEPAFSSCSTPRRPMVPGTL